MHPIELIELMIVGGILFLILFVSIILKGKWKKSFRRLAIVYLVSFGIFYFIRPYWIDLQIERKEAYLTIYLEDQYPGETWEFSTVPHREDGYEHINPYVIGVVFNTEPKVEYDYFIGRKDDIMQTGYSTQNEIQSDLLHLEVFEE
ncbi:hypothetical protein [Psychrobacillus sp.]|uniref:hypothetical protein n=1 Tax=Psychrobacillus sp. TaxID=1871623 RepID=UPI0028BE7025|nr:hypothetical protein [Psychrobacillus sp.]